MKKETKSKIYYFAAGIVIPIVLNLFIARGDAIATGQTNDKYMQKSIDTLTTNQQQIMIDLGEIKGILKYIVKNAENSK